MNQQDVANKVGVSQQYYQMIESGKRQKKMDVTLCAKLADALGIPIEEIIRQERHPDIQRIVHLLGY